MNKKLVFALYTLIVVCIGFATVIEKYRGTAFVSEQIYGAWWFSALWAVLTIAACAYMLERRLYKRAAVMLLHVSFVVILVGALTTHLFARRGTIRLRTDIPVISYVDKDNKINPLPFSLTLKDFRIINYPGTDAPLDYQSIIQSDEEEVIVSMNNIGYKNGYRLFQQSYDSDGRGVSLGVSYDPYGIAITYLGYLLLLIGIVATLLSRHTQMRALYRKAVTAVLLLLSISASANTDTLNQNSSPFGRGRGWALPIVDKDIAHRMGTINVLYNNRICPLNTVATDFVFKLTGSASWQGYSADEIFVSWMIYYSPWEQQKLIRVKSHEVQKLLGIDSQWASYCDFLNEYHEYKLQEAIDALRKGQGSVDKKGLMDADEKFHTVEMFYRGQFIRMFPYRLSPNNQTLKTPISQTTNLPISQTTNLPISQTTKRPISQTTNSPNDQVTWFSPGGQTLPREIPVKEQFFIKQSMDYLTESIVTGQRNRAFEIIAKIKLFQRDMIGDLLPSEGTTKTEIFYNAIRSQKWPVFLALTLSLLLCVVMLFQKTPSFILRLSLFTLHSSLFTYITLLLGLRWWLSGHIPVSNGPETMLFMAWVVLIFTYLLHRRSLSLPKRLNDQPPSPNTQHPTPNLIMAFGSLVASFCLLVAMLGGSSSQLTPLMPVLQSPLLSIHVMTVMCAYALFALQMLLGIQALFLMKKNCQLSIVNCQLERITALSQLLLYPAVFLLTIGIFLGAVWANVSWGNYWSWDPKESWALITLMVYAVPLHRTPLTTRQSPLYYHIYMVTAFLAVLITYFGVNYLLGGMHSYA